MNEIPKTGLQALLAAMGQSSTGVGAGRVRLSDADLRDRLGYYQQTTGIQITDEYAAAAKSIFCDIRNVFLTGGAGVGKTTFVKHVVIPELNNRGLNFAVTATTGIAGSHLDGKTLHSWAGIGTGPVFPSHGTPAADMTEEELDAVYERTYDEWNANPKMRAMRDGIRRRMKGTEVLLIDEISMCNGNALLGYLDFFLKRIREKQSPFGGIQVIFCGDFCQLPPVEKNTGTRADWAFLSRAWLRADVHPVQFTEVFRQSDLEFSGFLNRRRIGDPLTFEDAAYLEKFVRVMSPEEVIRASYLVPTNAQADELNTMALAMYPGPTVYIDAQYHIRQDELRNYETVENVKKKLLTGKLIKDRLSLRIGIPVLFIVNDRESRFVNGTKGTVQAIGYSELGDVDTVTVSIPPRPDATPPPGEDAPVATLVTLTRRAYSRAANEDPTDMTIAVVEVGGKKVTQEVHRYPVVKQFPLIPASAITIHKCVDKSTLVPTLTGVLEIEAICNNCDGVSVAGVTGYNSACEPHIGGKEMGYRIVTRRGYSLLCSERHPLLRVSSEGEAWVKSPNLKVGDVLRMRGNTLSFGDGLLPDYAPEPDHASSKPYTLPTVMSDDLAWALGALTGDGCGTDRRDGRFDLTTMDDAVAHNYGRIINGIFGVSATAAAKLDNPKVRTIYTHNWGVRKFLINLGFTHDKGPLKRIPAALWRGKQSHHAAYLRGLFDTDGGVGSSSVHLTSTSRDLIGDVHLMLLNLGIVATVLHMPRSNPNHNDGWRISITGVDVAKYQALIGFTIPYKIEACANLSPHRRKVPKAQCGEFPDAYAKSIVEALRRELVPVYPHKRLGALGFGEHQHWAKFLSRIVSPSGNASLTDAHLAAMLRDLPLCAEAGEVSSKVFREAVAGCFNDTIVSIELEEGDMRDIAVPAGHAFIGNGFVNHNCQGMSVDECVVDLRQSFAAGHVYVALSRLRSAEGLTLTGTDFAVKVDPEAMRYYRNIAKPTHP